MNECLAYELNVLIRLLDKCFGHVIAATTTTSVWGQNVAGAMNFRTIETSLLRLRFMARPELLLDAHKWMEL